MSSTTNVTVEIKMIVIRFSKNEAIFVQCFEDKLNEEEKKMD